MAERIEERNRTSSYQLSTQPTENAKTRQATNYGVKLFRDYCFRRGVDRIDCLNDKDIAKLLKGFYADVRTKDGQRFSVNSLIAIRYALSRFYYRLPQLSRKIDIVRGTAFDEANQIFRNVLKDLETQNRGQSGCQRVDVDTDDRHKLRHYFVHAIHTPRGLLHKVWYDLMLQIGRKGRDGQRMLSKSSFVIGTSTDGRQYIYQTDDEEGGNIILENPGDLLCPVKNFRMYLARLNPACDALFQRPKDRISKQDLCWYVNSPVGKNMLATMMSTISKCAGLSRVYTNIRIRATMYSEAQENGCISCEVLPIKNVTDANRSHNISNEMGTDGYEIPAESIALLSNNVVGNARNNSCTIQVSEDKSLLVTNPQEFVKSSASSSMIKISSTTSLSVFPVALSRACPDSTQSSSDMQHLDKVTQSSTLQGLNRNQMCSSSEIKSQNEQSDNTKICTNVFNQHEHINKCATCNTILKNQGGILLTAGRLGKRLFCSTGCLGQWVSQDNNKSISTSSSSSSSSSSLPTCDYCQIKQTPKYHLIGDNGVVQKFCSSNCMVHYKNSPINGHYGTVPWCTESDKSSYLSDSDSPIPVISSVVSLSTDQTTIGMEDDEESPEDEDDDEELDSEEEENDDGTLGSPVFIVPDELPTTSTFPSPNRKHKMKETIPRSVHSLLPQSKCPRNDYSSCLKPAMTSVSVLCKPNMCSVGVQVGPSNNYPTENGISNPGNCLVEPNHDHLNSKLSDDNLGDYKKDLIPLQMDISIDSSAKPDTQIYKAPPKLTAPPHIITLDSFRFGRMSRKMSWDEVAQRSKLQTMWAVKLFRDWLQCRKKLQPDFENLSPIKLGEMLQEFYSNLKKPDGDDYSVSTFHSIRASINRYLSLPPHSKPFSIIRGSEFQNANEAFFKRVKSIQHNSWCPPQITNNPNIPNQ
ncbi:uncharacterized protein [Centruroides vittatus]|uniref:uncharacterized protein n=1 Tax=Centruroides vittatus TaxID=120091 RepID=UPI003510C52A